MPHTLPLKNIFSIVSRLALSRRVAAVVLFLTVLSGVATYFVLAQKSDDLDAVYLLLNLDLILLLLMGTITARQVTRLWNKRKRGSAGAKLHVKLVYIFAVLAATPAILMAIFSSVFLYFGVNAWFNERVGTAIQESQAVAQAYLHEHQQVLRADVMAMEKDLNREIFALNEEPETFNEYMETQSNLRNLPEAVVISADGKVIARSRLSFTLAFDVLPQENFERAKKGEVVLFESDDRNRIRALVKLDRFADSYLYVGRMVDASVLAHMDATEKAVEEYTVLLGKKSQLQVSVAGVFLAVALLLLLAAIWFGLTFSQQLVAPIGALIAAADRVRQGDLTARVEESLVDDEIALLGKTFNRMTSQIQGQRDELIATNRMLDERRRFSEAVLSGASSGIIGLDHKGIITLANARAEELLTADGKTILRRTFFDLIPETAELFDKARALQDKPAALQIEFTTKEGLQKSLFIRIVAEEGGEGAVATIDDVSTLVSAQRKAAWADVARRIAHEIKNPLTPIQLSAERLKRKYLPQISEDPETFEKCTETIVRQVHDIGRMVNEFSSYARMPVAVKKPEDIVSVCQDVFVLHKESCPQIHFGFIAAAPTIFANCDRAQLTQVLTNLLKNAIESVEERIETRNKNEDGHIRLVIEEKGEHIAISVIDNGLGLPETTKNKLTEPYVTTKKTGSGLGLAIVQKIMEDHEGSVLLEDNFESGQKSGAKAMIVFPKDMKA